MKRKLSLLIVAAPALAYCVALITGWPSLVYGNAEWVWTRRPAPLSVAFLWPLLLMVAWTALVAWRERRPTRTTVAPLLIGAVLVSGFLPYTLLSLRGDPIRQMLQITASTTSGSYFNVGARIDDPNEFLIAHIDRMGGYREVHARTHPPGIPLIFYMARKLFEAWPGLGEQAGRRLLRADCLHPEMIGFSYPQVASALAQFALPFFGGLGVLPLFALAQTFFGRRTALLAVGLYPFIPALSAFAPAFNQLYVPIALAGSWLTWQSIINHRVWPAYALAAGLLLSLGSFISFGNIAFLGLNGFLVGGWLVTKRHNRADWGRAITIGLLMIVGLSTVWIVYWLGWGVSGIAMYRRALEVHGDIGRSYWLWAWYNLYDFASWTGLALLGPALWLCWQSRRRRRWSALALGLLGFILLLDFSAFVLGETARLWLFLSPLWMLLGVAGAVRLRLPSVALLALMGTQAIVAGWMLQPIESGREGQGSPTPVYQLPSDAQPLDFTLDGSIRLAGYNVDDDRVTLYWQALKPLAEDFTVFVHATDSNGQLVAGHDGQPQDGQLPTHCWLAGEVVADTHVLGMPPGEIQFSAGMYRWPELQRLPVSPPQPGETILLQP
ncbi:MAG: hypothetical protein HYZ49_03295 [Chloroflexi bacterium]|nr:hypothetical protein [Chloroflexota bacterium]